MRGGVITPLLQDLNGPKDYIFQEIPLPIDHGSIGNNRSEMELYGTAKAAAQRLSPEDIH